MAIHAEVFGEDPLDGMRSPGAKFTLDDLAAQLVGRDGKRSLCRNRALQVRFYHLPMARLRPLFTGAPSRSVFQTPIRRLLTQFRREREALNQGTTARCWTVSPMTPCFISMTRHHRWAGEHRGRDQIETFLGFRSGRAPGEKFSTCGTSGPPPMTAVARFDDRSTGPDGQEFSLNQTMIMVRDQMGKVTSSATSTLTRPA